MNKKTNWLIKHTITVFSCVLIIVLGITAISFADPVTTMIGENISTNDLTAVGDTNLASTTLNGDLTVDTDTLYVDTENNRVGIGTNTPSSKLDISGDLNIAETLTTRTGVLNTLKNVLTYNPAVDTPDPNPDIFGINSEVSIIGAEDMPWVDGHGHTVGVIGHSSHDGTGTMGFLIGTEGAISVSNTGNVTAVAGLVSNLLENNATITDWYGLYLADIDTTNITNTYSVYSADSNATLFNSGGAQFGGTVTGTDGFVTTSNFYAYSSDWLKHLDIGHNGTNGVLAVSSGNIVLSGGNVGINNTAPSTKLEVDGIIKTTPTASRTCDADSEGGIYYDSDVSHFYGCNGTDWVQLDN